MKVCGRFVSASTADELAQYFEAFDESEHVELNYNVAPTSEIYAIARTSGMRILKTMRWGLVPFWAKDNKIGASMFNARSETVAEKPVFKNAFKKRRCLIPADGFYEWRKDLSGSNEAGHRATKSQKQPYYLTHSGEEPFAFAGIWEKWFEPPPKNSQDQLPGFAQQLALPESATIESCAIVTCEANKKVAPIHDRMPVIISPRDWDSWLSNETSSSKLSQLLNPAPDAIIKLFPVRTNVNYSTNNFAELVEPLDATDHR